MPRKAKKPIPAFGLTAEEDKKLSDLISYRDAAKASLQARLNSRSASLLGMSGLPRLDGRGNEALIGAIGSWGGGIGSRIASAKNLSSSVNFVQQNYNFLENVYAANPIAQKIVNLVCEYALLNLWRFEFSDVERETALKLQDEVRDKIDPIYRTQILVPEAARWGRLYGDCYMVLNIKDGRHPSKPINEDNIQKIEWIENFTPGEVFVLNHDWQMGSRYLEPEFYSLATYGARYVSKIHSSRVIRFRGIPLPRFLYVSNRFVNNSAIMPCYEALSAYSLAIEAAALAIIEYSQVVYKIKGLSSMVKRGKMGLLIKRFQQIDDSKSIARSVVMDADSEGFDRVSGRFSGISEIIEKLEKFLVATSKIPHNLLFSEAAGHNKTMMASQGDSEWTEWQSTVFSYQRDFLARPLERLYRLIFLDKSNPLYGNQKLSKSRFKIRFSGERKISQEKEAQLYEAISTTDQSWLDKGILAPDEVRASRFAKGGTFSDYSIQLSLDDSAYKKMREDRERQAAAMTPGGPMAPGGPAQKGGEEDAPGAKGGGEYKVTGRELGQLQRGQKPSNQAKNPEKRPAQGPAQGPKKEPQKEKAKEGKDGKKPEKRRSNADV